jgi:hypothetical protein
MDDCSTGAEKAKLYCITQNHEFCFHPLLQSASILCRPKCINVTIILLASPTSGGRSVGIARSRTKTTELSYYYYYISILLILHYNNINTILYIFYYNIIILLIITFYFVLLFFKQDVAESEFCSSSGGTYVIQSSKRRVSNKRPDNG